MKNNKGFTMVELVVTIAILAILATTVTLSVTAVINSSKRKTQQAEIESAYSTCGAVFTEINSGFSTIEISNLNEILKQRIGSNVQTVRKLDSSGKADSYTQSNIGNISNGFYIYYRYGKLSSQEENQYYVDTIYYIVDGNVWKIALVSNKALLDAIGAGSNATVIYNTKLYYNGSEVSTD